MFTIKQLESFKLVVQYGTTAQAALRLHATESAVAKRLRELEAALGVELFRREGRRQILTEKGRELWKLSLALLEVRDSIAEVAKSPGYHGHTFRLGMTELVAHFWLTALVEDIRTKFDDLVIEPHIGLSLDMVDMVKEGDLDLAILPKTSPLPRMNYTPLFRSANRWVCRPGYIDTRVALTPLDLVRYALVLQHSHSILHQTVQQWFMGHDAGLPNIITCNSLKGAKDLVMAGFGIAYLPELFCRAELADGRLESFSVRPAVGMRTYVAMFQTRDGTSLAAQMASIIQKTLRGHVRSKQTGGI